MNSGTVAATSERLVTAYFGNRVDAERAIDRLVAAGIAREGIGLRERGGAGARRDGDKLSFPEASARLWESLRLLFLPWAKVDTDIPGLPHDGCLVSVRAGDADYQRIVAILGDKGVIEAVRLGKVAVFPGKNS